MSLLGKR